MSEKNEIAEGELEFEMQLRAVAKADGRFDVEAYKFVNVALHHTVTLRHTVSELPEQRHATARELTEGIRDLAPEQRHVTARELLEGIRDLAKEKFGLLARTVFERWGVSSTNDFGEIVFTLVNHGLMGKTDEDKREDFDNVYEFKKVLEDEFIEELPRHMKLST